MPAGDVGLYREVGGGTSYSSSGANLDLDTTDFESPSSFSLASGVVTVKEACRLLCLAGMEAAKDAGSAETALMRVEVDQNTGTFLAEPGSYCQGYFPDANGVAKAPMSAATLIDAVASAKIRLYAETKSSSVLESASRTFLQLYRMPSALQVVHLLRSSNLNTIGTSYVDVPWNSEIIKDSSWTHSNSTVPAAVTWTGPASRVLLLLCLTISNPTGTSPDRLAVGAHVLKNGSAVDFSQATGHLRGTGDDINTTLRLAIPIDLATSDVIKVQVKVFARPGSQTARVISNRATMSMIALPGNSNWIRMRNSADQGANSSSLDFACNTEDEKGPAYTHSTSTNNSEVTLNRARKTLLGFQVAIDRGASATADNIAWDAYFRKNNTTDLLTRGGGGYSEGTQASVAYRESSMFGASIVPGVVNDIYELRIDKIGSGSDSNANFLGGTGETKSLIWALDLDDVTGTRGVGIGYAQDSAQLTLQRRLEGSGLGSGLDTSALGSRQRLEGRGTGEGSGSAAVGRISRIEAAEQGHATSTATLSRMLGLDAIGLGDSSSTALLARAQALEASGLGSAAATAALTQRRLLEALGYGAAAHSAELTDLLRLEAFGLGSAAAAAEIARLQHLGAQGLGEALPWLQELFIITHGGGGAVEVLLEGAGLAEGFGSAQLTLLRRLEGRGWAEAPVSAPVGVGLGLAGQALGSAPASLGLVLKVPLEARASGEAQITAALTRLRAVESLLRGESVGAAQLTRLTVLEARVLGGAGGTAALRLVLGVAGPGIGQAISKTDLGVRLALQALAHGESAGLALLGQVIKNRYAVEIEVVRRGAHLVAYRAGTPIQVQRQRLVVDIPLGEEDLG